MDAAAAALAAVIGARVRTERRAQDLTLDQLAAAADVSRRMVVSVEQGAVNPSVGTLLRLGNALGIALSALVETAASDVVQVVRAGDGPALWTGEAGGRGVLVASTAPPHAVELWDWTLRRGEGRSSEAHAAGTRELIQVLHGAVELTCGHRSEVLRAGDAASFRGDLPHGYAHAGRGAARFSLAVHEPLSRS